MVGRHVLYHRGFPLLLARRGNKFFNSPQWFRPISSASTANYLNFALPTRKWASTPLPEDREKVWHEMLQIHADRTFVISLINGTLQAVLVSNRLRNVSEDGIYNWEPSGHLGIHQPDTFWFVPDAGSL